MKKASVELRKSVAQDGPDSGAAKDLQRIAQMADVYRSAARDVQLKEDALSLAQKTFTRIEQEDFPALMQEVGLTEVKLEDGTTLTLTPDIQCSISEERRPVAHGWLRDNKFAGIIKSLLVLEFGVGEDEKKMKVAKALVNTYKIVPMEKESIHPATLKSFIKERRAEGKSPPEALFGINPFNRVKLKDPKK